MIIQVLALLALVLALWTVFRFAMGLRWAKVSREDARAAEQARGRRVVAEIPGSEDEVVFFVEDDAGFYWGGRQARKRDIRGARLLLNGAVMASFARDGELLPETTPPEAQSFKTRPDLRPPDLKITRSLPGASNDDLFLGVKGGAGRDGPTIRDRLGRLIWFLPIHWPFSRT